MALTSQLTVCKFMPTAGGTTDWTFSAAVTGYNSPALAGVVNSATYHYRAESADLSQWEVGTGIYNTGTGVLTRATVLYNSSGTGTASGQSGAGTKISFSSTPSIGIGLLAEDVPQKLPTTQSLTSGSSATYTTPTGVQWIEVFMVGGGGGGAGTTNGSPGALVAGSGGGTTTFNSINAAGGSGAASASVASPASGGAGGTGGTGSATRRQNGSSGGNGLINVSVNVPTGFGGNSFLGAGAQVVAGNPANGNSAAANSGGGGSGANAGTAANVLGGGGGGGEFAYLLITSPAATYSYTVGSSGAGGVGGAQTGGAGGTGFIFVIEHYGS